MNEFSSTFHATTSLAKCSYRNLDVWILTALAVGILLFEFSSLFLWIPNLTPRLKMSTSDCNGQNWSLQPCQPWHVNLTSWLQKPLLQRIPMKFWEHPDPLWANSSCGKFPTLRVIKFHNRDWQEMENKGVPGGRIFLSLAIFDNRFKDGLICVHAGIRVRLD